MVCARKGDLHTDVLPPEVQDENTRRKVIFFTDHKSLKSWYKEDHCTMAGSLHRPGCWHELSSRYNILVVYKPGKDNDVTDGMNRWAYPAGLVDETNFHGSDTDLKGYED